MNKNYQIELMRVVSCVLVVVIHVSNIYSRSYPDISVFSYLTSLATNSVARISVPIFFMISGALLLSKSVDMKKYWSRIKRFAIITAVWWIFYFLWTTFYLGHSYNFRNIIAIPPSTHLWFLYAILGIYISLPLIQILFAHLNAQMERLFIQLWFVSTTVVYILSFLGVESQYGIPIISGCQYLGFFVLGHLMLKYQHQMLLKTKTCVLGFVACNIAIVSLTVLGSFVSGSHEERLFQYRDPLIILSSVFAFLLFQRVDVEKLSDKTKNIIAHISNHSFGIYLVHAVFLNILDATLVMTKLPAMIGIPIYLMFIFVVTDATVWLMNKVKYLRYII